MIVAEYEAKDILEQSGIPVVPARDAATVERAAEEANHLGYPVALKLSGSLYVHKTEVGGVLLNIEDDRELERAFQRLQGIRERLDPSARIIVEPMAPPGAEFFIGIQRHPSFGLLISFGTGGIWLELIKDVSFRLLPATRGDLLEMFQELRSWPRLRQGFRHLPPVNPEPLVDIMEQIGSMSLEWPVLMEMDLNPVIAGPEGAVVADARIVLRERTLEAQYIVKSCS